MVLKRCLTALALLGFVIPLIIFAPTFWVILVVLLIAGFALYDFFNHALQQENHTWRYVGIGMGVGVSSAVCFGGLENLGWILAFIIFITLSLILLRFSLSYNAVNLAGLILLGTLYIGFLFSHMGLILTLPEGKQWAGLVVISTAMVDIGAFCGGYFFGRKKLCPSVSPNKTVEGAVGGMMGGILGVLICKLVFFTRLSPAEFVGFGVGIGILSQLGDLCESMLKRSLKIKDFGSYLPAHGGFLDRIDSLLFTAPFVFYMAVFSLIS
jgi:phosphatidate cytidylyltransferase